MLPRYTDRGRRSKRNARCPYSSLHVPVTAEIRPARSGYLGYGGQKKSPPSPQGRRARSWRGNCPRRGEKRPPIQDRRAVSTGVMCAARSAIGPYVAQLPATGLCVLPPCAGTTETIRGIVGAKEIFVTLPRLGRLAWAAARGRSRCAKRPVHPRTTGHSSRAFGPSSRS